MENGKDIVKMGENFTKMFQTNLNSKTDKKGAGKYALTYLSWSEAWGEFVKQYADATYQIHKNDKSLPYFSDDSGAIVYVSVTANNLTHEMMLPVMDGANKAMKDKPYTYQVKEYVYDETQRKQVATGNMIDKKVEPYTMFDINKTIMRCLTKCLAMFGLGLYIYNNEDMPEVEEEPIQRISSDQVKIIEDLIKTSKADREKFLIAFKIKSLAEMPVNHFTSAVKSLNTKIEKMKEEKQ